uniref:DMT family transporter n=1 Tax=Roseburia sp. TaxID=2049040 RepID=UPI003FEEF7A8
MKISNKYRGIFYIILAAFGFAFMNLFVKLAGDLPAIEKSFFRNLVAIFFAFIVMKKKNISFSIPKESRKYIFFRSLFGTIGIFANFYAIGKLYIADASMLNKLSPFFAIIFSYFLLHEKIKPYQLLCVLTAFVGALFILRPGFDSVATFPAFIGLIGGMGAGLAYTNVRLATKHGAPGPLIVFCFSVFSCVCAIPFIIFDHQPLAWWQLASLLLAGLSATLGQFSITAAYTYAPASELSVYDYTQIVFAALLGIIFLGEVPDIISVLGYLIICGAGIAMFLIRRKKEREA